MQAQPPPAPTGQNSGSSGLPQPNPLEEKDTANIYIANLDLSINKEILEQIFAPFGKIRESRVLTDLTSGRTKGAALLRYESPASAEAAIAAMNGTVLPGTTLPLIVKLADSPAEKMRKKARFLGRGGYPGIPPRAFPPYAGATAPGYGAPPYPPAAGPNAVAVYVANLPPEADEGFLYKLFGIYGAIASVRIIRDPGSTACKGYGFVNFLRFEDAQNAILNMHGYQLGDKFLQVKFKTDKVGSYSAPPGAYAAGFAPAFIGAAGGGAYPPPAAYAAAPAPTYSALSAPATYGSVPSPGSAPPYGNVSSPGAAPAPMGTPGPYRPY